MASRNAETIRRLRREAAERGDCYECRARPAKGHGVKRCQVCLDRSAANNDRIRAKHIAAGLCPCGRERRTGFRWCVRCQLQAQVKQADLANARRAAGLCPRCGNGRDKDGRVICRECRTQINAYVKARYWARKGV